MVRSIAALFRYLVNVLFILSLLGWCVYVFNMWRILQYNPQLWGVMIGVLFGIVLAFGVIYVLLDISLTLHDIERQNLIIMNPYGQPPVPQQPPMQPQPQMASPQMAAPQMAQPHVTAPQTAPQYRAQAPQQPPVRPGQPMPPRR